MTTALITGATAGLGWTFAQQLAASGHDLVLVARDEARLQARAETLRSEFGVDVEVLSADLSVLDDLRRVGERAGSRTRAIDLVVNNAGFGLGGTFARSPLDDELRLLDVLCRAVLVICHEAVPAMIERGRGAILNVSSVAGFTTQGTYSAAKAWVTCFSESLAGELTGTGVRVCAVCPGFTRTEFHERADLQMAALPGIAWLTADDVVREGLADLRRGTVVSVPSVRYKVAMAGLRMMPRPLQRMVSNRMAWSRFSD